MGSAVVVLAGDESIATPWQRLKYEAQNQIPSAVTITLVAFSRWDK